MTPSGIRVVSINIWDLPVYIPRANRRKRLARLLDALPTLDADIIFIQEAFRPRFRARLREALSGYRAAPDPDPGRRVAWIRMDRAGGLMTFSRWSLDAPAFRPWTTPRRMRLDERIGRKGSLWTRIDTPFGMLVTANVHLYAGNAPVEARARRAQVRELLARGTLAGSTPTLLMGDFNMAIELEQPYRGRTGFDYLRDAGFTEIAGGRTDGIATMAPQQNRYAAMIQRNRTDRRLTQVFTRGLTAGTPGPQLCLRDPPVSDHFGLKVELVLD